MNLKDQLKDRIALNIDEVLQELNKIFLENSDNRNLVFQFRNSLKRFQRDKLSGVLSQQEYNREVSAVEFKTMELIDQITEEEALAYELEESIFNKILVVSLDVEKESIMKKLFSEKYYKNVDFDNSGKLLGADLVNRYDLVVFNNHLPGEDNAVESTIIHLLDKTKPYLLYFGRNLPLLYKYPFKAYFANSPFSIHARIREMIDYLKYSDVKK